MDINIIKKENEKQKIGTNDLVVVHQKNNGETTYGIVVEEVDGYNVIVLDNGSEGFFEPIYLNESELLSHHELQSQYTLVKKANDYKITIEL